MGRVCRKGKVLRRDRFSSCCERVFTAVTSLCGSAGGIKTLAMAAAAAAAVTSWISSAWPSDRRLESGLRSTTNGPATSYNHKPATSSSSSNSPPSSSRHHRTHHQHDHRSNIELSRPASASEMTYIVSSGALNSTPTNSSLLPRDMT